MVKLQVALNGSVISNAVIFEYKNASKSLESLKSLEDDEEELELSAELLTIVEESNNIIEGPKPVTEPVTRESHNLYLCDDISCQRILKTMLLQKLDDLIQNIDEGQKRSPLSLQCRSPRYSIFQYFSCWVSYFSTMVYFSANWSGMKFIVYK